MATVLVVDDDAAFRELVGRILRDVPDVCVQTACDGQEALEAVACRPPDVILTDLRMPRIDGLQLVEQLRRQHSAIPVILMTAFGSEETASLALQKGAASYVPKAHIVSGLHRTVSDILAIAASARADRQLHQSMVRSEALFRLENDPALIKPLVGYIQEDLAWMGLRDANGRTLIGVALHEALANAIIHGNLEVTSALREEDTEAYHALIEQRRCEPPYCERRVDVSVTLLRDEARFIVRDEGPGFAVDQISDPTLPENLDRLGGRGLFLIRSFMDSVRHNSCGNEITMTLRRQPDQTPAAAPATTSWG